MEALLTQRDAAMALRCSERTLERLRLTGGVWICENHSKGAVWRVIQRLGSLQG